MEKLVRFERSRDAWQRRTEAIRGAILTGAQLSPLPERTALNARFANRRFRGTYSVEDVAFEAKPGFYVFGNLYRPLHPAGRVPAILVAHGHFYERGLYARARAENQILCVTLAKMGAAVFTYDMVGWGDSQQVDHHAHHALQLQLWDSIRSLDFLESLPEVDPERIGATGASGGARKSFRSPLLTLESMPACRCDGFLSLHWYGPLRGWHENTRGSWRSGHEQC